MLAALAPEHRALILLRFGRIAEAQPFVDQALKTGPGREARLRGFRPGLSEGRGPSSRGCDGARPCDGLGPRWRDGPAGQGRRCRNRRQPKRFSELLVVLAAELHRLRNERLPVALSQIARYVAPQNSTASVMLGLMLSRRDRVDDAVAALRNVPMSDPMSSQARRRGSCARRCRPSGGSSSGRAACRIVRQSGRRRLRPPWGRACQSEAL